MGLNSSYTSYALDNFQDKKTKTKKHLYKPFDNRKKTKHLGQQKSLSELCRIQDFESIWPHPGRSKIEIWIRIRMPGRGIYWIVMVIWIYLTQVMHFGKLSVFPCSLFIKK